MCTFHCYLTLDRELTKLSIQTVTELRTRRFFEVFRLERCMPLCDLYQAAYFPVFAAVADVAFSY